jgi:uncharacterized protein DUF6982
MQVKIVVRYVDGRIAKGHTADLSPEKPRFHLLGEQPQSTAVTEIWMKDLKAVFFVRDFSGNPEHNERKEFAPGERPPGLKVRVEFLDGEVLVGYTMGYSAARPSFYLTPVDPTSNNERVLVIRQAVKGVTPL